MEHPEITEARARYHRVIAKHYGKRYVSEVASMILVGSEAYCNEVMRAHGECHATICRVTQELTPESD